MTKKGVFKMLWRITNKEKEKVSAEFTRLEDLYAELRKDIKKLKEKRGGKNRV
jgi:predicted DNA-binding antitoxin AbrB/MazE fold protein